MKFLKSWPARLIVLLIVLLIIKYLPTEYLTRILTLFISVVGIIWAVFVMHKYAPNARLTLSYKLSPSGFIILLIEVENLSEVKIDKEHIKLQILKYKASEINTISEFVPFNEDEVIPDETPIEWSNPIDIFKTTKSIYPRERKHVERLIEIPSEDIIFHIGLQVKVSLKGFKGLISGILNWDSMQRTYTIFVLPDDIKYSFPPNINKDALVSPNVSMTK